MAKPLLKPHKTPVEQGQFGATIEQAMRDRGLSLEDLKGELELTYEHTRRLMKSLSYPSKATLDRICKFFGLNKEEMKKMVTADKLQARYGDTAHEVFGTKPKYAKLIRTLDRYDLNEEQMETINRLVDSAVKIHAGH